MHAHGLIKTIEDFSQNKSSRYLDFAVKILYSIRKYWADYAVTGENVELFKHWWDKWGSITHADGCNHPVQMLLMLGAYDLTQLGLKFEEHDIMGPLINLLNETLARKIRIKLIG